MTMRMPLWAWSAMAPPARQTKYPGWAETTRPAPGGEAELDADTADSSAIPSRCAPGCGPGHWRAGPHETNDKIGWTHEPGSCLRDALVTGRHRLAQAGIEPEGGQHLCGFAHLRGSALAVP